MKSTFAALALVASALANPMPQGVSSAIAPKSSAPAGCSSSTDGTFAITVVNVTSSSKRTVERRQESGLLSLSLNNGVLKDGKGRTGYIAANNQFQFDAPPQTGAIYTSGFSLCGNKSLAIGDSAVFYACYSGGFYNLYDKSTGNQCNQIYLVAQSDGSGGSPSQISDGQPQATTVVPSVTQIADGQPQVPTAAPAVSQISDGQPQAPTGGAVTQISDGQPQAPTGGAPVTQISDGQPQAPTGAPVTQISDGQPQAPTGAPVTQISDGQPQAPTGAPVTQISDGQPQAPIPTANGTFTASTPPAQYTGAAASQVYGLGAVAAGVMGVFALL